MLTKKGVVAVLALVAGAAVLDGVHACTCLVDGSSGNNTLCDFYEEADVVVRAEVLSRNKDGGGNGIINYTIDTINFYKGESSIVGDSQELSVLTGRKSDACGVKLEIGEQYLLGLHYNGAPFNSEYDDDLSVGLCGLYAAWISVDEKELDQCIGACGETCDEYQECLYDYELSVYYCDNTCNTSPCGEDETCTPLATSCSLSPSQCPTTVICGSESCESECTSEFQECVWYGGYFCATTTCDPDPCGQDEVCSTFQITCQAVLPACFPNAYCSPGDPCDGECSEFQDCLYDEWVLKHYCADTCDPSPCADDEVCSLSSAVCFGSPSACWPNAICDNSAHP